MASRAITKAARRVAGEAISKARKRAKEANTVEKLVSGGVAPAGSLLAAALDAYEVGIPVGESRIPLAPFGAALGMGSGLAVKGGVGAGLFGFGVGQLCGWITLAAHEKLVKMRAEAAAKKAAAADDEDDEDVA